MMFDPPDFPYKELNESLRANNFNPDDIFSNNNTSSSNHIISPTTNDLVQLTEQMISNVENQLTFHSNESGRYFNDNAEFLQNSDAGTNYVAQLVQADNLFDEPTLLDDNTVNQFLLPLKDGAISNKEFEEANGPDLLALHSCVICHEIFTTDYDLLDHTILMHASENSIVEENTCQIINKDVILPSSEVTTSAPNFDSEWLICNICERVLSTALEVEPNERLCCSDGSGKGSVCSRKLDTMYVCDFCSGLFADGEALDRHRLSCFPQQQNYYANDMDGSNGNSNSTLGLEVGYSCEICGKQHSTREELRSHASECFRAPISKGSRRPYTSQGNNKMWNCGSCNQLFATARDLYRHKRGEDREPGAPLMAYVCEECDKVLGSMCALHTHKKMHKVTKPGYPCRICGRRFNQSGHLAIHMRMHTGERPYPCDLCPKAFKVKVERDDHRRTHTGERPFACTACPKTFTAAARLREHARIHTDQRPYRCDICGAAFRRPYARTVHTLIHTGEKPHECDICGTAFRRSGDMWKHKRTLHGIQTINES